MVHGVSLVVGSDAGRKELFLRRVGFIVDYRGHSVGQTLTVDSDHHLLAGGNTLTNLSELQLLRANRGLTMFKHLVEGFRT